MAAALVLQQHLLMSLNSKAAKKLSAMALSYASLTVLIPGLTLLACTILPCGI